MGQQITYVMTMIHWSPCKSRIKKKRTMIVFGLFLDKFERIANLRSTLASELCYTGHDNPRVSAFYMNRQR